MNSANAIDAALELAGAADLVRSLPEGVRTRLDGDEVGRSCDAFCSDGAPSHELHGLSGGEVGFHWDRCGACKHHSKTPSSHLVATHSHLARSYARTTSGGRAPGLRRAGKCRWCSGFLVPGLCPHCPFPRFAGLLSLPPQP